MKKKSSKNKHSETHNTTDPTLVHIESLMQLMQQNKIAELEIEDTTKRIRLRGYSETHPHTSIFQPPGHHSLNHPSPTSPTATAEKKEVTHSPSQKQITCPFVGTFYRAPSPTAEPYVREGQVVKKGDVLCIIEAMKLMNEIESEFAGRIISILVENGQPVEFGEPLFLIETG